MSQNESPISLNIENSIAHISMDDGKVNALSFQLIADLAAALDEASKSELVLLSGNAKVFCAGFDLKVIQGPPKEATKLMRAGVDLFTQIFDYPKPVVAACTGHAIAGGAILLMCADYRVGPDNPEISIGLNEVSIGMVVPPFLIEIANARLAKERLHESLNLAKLYSPEDAKNVGFLDTLTKDSVVETAMKESQGFVENLDSEAFQKTKKRLRGATSDTLRKLNQR